MRTPEPPPSPRPHGAAAAPDAGAPDATARAAPHATNPAARVTERACPLCAGQGGRELLRQGRWRLIECAACGLAYLPEIPSPGAVETEFEWLGSFRRERRQRWLNSPLARFWTAAFLLLKPSREGRALRRIRRHVRTGRLVDVGAGDGRLAALAQRRGYDVRCVELSPAMASRAARRVGAERVLVGRLEDLALEPGSADVVTAVSFLEHEPAPLSFLRRARELLCDGGTLVIKVPNFDCLLRRLRGRRWSGYRWPEHVQYFTPATLSALVSAAGLVVGSVSANPLSDNFWLVARRRPC